MRKRETIEDSLPEPGVENRSGTMNLDEAAAFLHMNPEALRQKAKVGVIPGAKIGKCWIFIEVDLVRHIRSRYAAPRQAVRVTSKEVKSCHSTAGVKPGGSTLRRQMGSEYADLLGLVTARKPSTTMTS